MNPDQENLLSTTEREQAGQTFTVHSNRSYNSLIANKSLRKNLLLLVLSIFIASCLTVYLYLNLVAINGNQSEQTNYKPLSRRKPILDHESFFSDSGPSMIKLSDLLAHCVVALRVAGQEVVRLSLKNNDKLGQVGSKGKTLEGVDDIVTGADLKSHEMILNTIKDSYRRLNVVSEEDTTKAFEGLKVEDDILPIKRVDFARMLRENLHEIENDQKHGDHSTLIAQHETLVWIDPLDATKEYSENLTEYVTLMACIVHKSVPIAGIIYKPFHNLTYWSVRDESTNTIQHSPDLLKLLALGNDRRRAISNNNNNNRPGKPHSSDQLKVIVSRSHAGDVEKMLHNVYGDQVMIKPAGGSGYKTLELLAGSVDVYTHVTHIKKWDICAPHAILNSIPSGNLTTLTGEQIHFGDPKDKVVKGGLIATLNKTIHRKLISSLKGTMADSNR